MRFYLDEDVDVRVAGLLRGFGHQVTDTQGQGRKGASDPDQLVYSTRDSRILVTHNGRHFAVLHSAWSEWAVVWKFPAHAGILVLDQVYPAERIAGAIRRLCEATPGLSAGGLAYRWWGKQDEWERLTP